MPANVDERIVQMRFDNAQFEANASKTMQTIDSLKDKLNFNGLNAGFEEIENASGKVTMSRLMASTEEVSRKFSVMSIAAITAIQNVVNSAVNAGRQIVKSLTVDPVSQGFSEYELKMGSVQTIMASTGESLQTVNGYLNELNTYADRTIYSFSDMTRNIGKFTNAGVKLEDAVAAIQGISNEAAISGANANEASRAMYNFAQALSSGAVRLIDWKSIENANMATVEFKEQLIQTALEVGTLVQKGDEFVSTTTDLNGKVSEAFTSTTRFNDSLSAQWMTTDVLVKTLNKYADETTDLGKKAFAAAQDVKTFTQLMDTLKEAVGSGWATTWEIVFGDFNEAKDLWTQVSNALGGIIDNASTARNELLQGGLSTGWKNFIAQGISDATGFQDALVDIADKEVGGISELIKEAGSFEKTLSEGWVTGDLLGKALDNVVTKISKMSKAELENAGYTDDQVTELYKLKNAVDNGSISLEDFADKINRPSGRENIIQSVKNALSGLDSILTPIREGLSNLFPKVTGEDLYNFTVKLKELTSRFGLSKEAAEGLRNIVSTLSKPFEYLSKAVAAGFGIFGSFVVRVGELANSFLELFSNGGLVTQIFEDLTSTTIFTTFTSILERAKQAVLDFINVIFGLGTEASDQVNSFGSTVVEKFSPIEGIGDILSKLFDTIGNALTKAAPLVSGLGEKMYNAISTMLSKLSELDFGGVMQAITAGILSTGLLNSINNFSDKIDGFKNLGERLLPGVKGIFGTLSYTINSFKNSVEASVNSGVIQKVAIAIGILSASLIALALTDPEHLGAAMGAITGLFVELMGSLKIFTDEVNPKKLSSINKASTLFIKFSVSILILAVAVRALASLDWDGLAKGLVGVGALCLMMTKSVESLSKSGADKKLSKAALGFIAFAAAIRILVSSVKALAELDWESLAKGLIGVGVLCTELSLFMQNTDFDGFGVMKGVGFIALAAAIKILASAVSDFGAMKPEEIVKGLISVGIVMGELMVFIDGTEDAKKVISTSIGMVILGAAMIVFASAVEKFGQIPLEQLVTGLIGMGVALVEIAIALQLMPDNTLTISVGVILVAEAMNILAQAMDAIGKMSWESIVKALVGIGAALLEFAIGLNLMKGTLGASAALLVAAAAINVLTPALVTLGNLSLQQLVISLLAVAGAFGVLVAAGYLLTPVAGTITTISLAISALLISLSLFMAAIAMMTAADTANALAAPFVELRNIANIEFFKQLGALIANMLIGIFDTILAAGDHIVNGLAVLLMDILVAIEQVGPKLIQVVVDLIVMLLDALVEHSPEIINAGFDLLDNLLTGFSENIDRIVDTVTELITNFLDSLSENLPILVEKGAEFILDFIDSLGEAIEEYAPRLMSSVVRLGGHIISGLVEGFFDQIIEAKNAIVEVGTKIINAIKEFFGINSPSTVFKEIGENVIKGLINGIKGMAEDAVTAITNVGKNILEGIKGFFGIKSPSVKMKDEVGHYIVEGIAEGIEEDDSAEEASEKKAQNIINAFKEALDSADLEMTTAELQYKLWKSLNPDASEADAYEAQATELEGLLKLQAEKVRLAEGEYKSIVEQFPNDSKKIREAQNKWLQQQIQMADYATQLSDLNKSYSETVNSKADENKQALKNYYDLIIQESDTIDKLVESGFNRDDILASYQKKVGYDPNMSIDKTLANSETDVNKIIDTYMQGVAVTVEFGLENSVQEGTEEAAKNTSNSSQAAGDSVSKDVAKGVTDSKDSVSTAVSTTITQAVSDGVSKANVDGKGIGQALLTGITESLNAIKDVGINAANNLFTSFSSIFINEEEGNKMFNIGVSLIDAFGAGLTSQAESIATSIQAMISNAICGDDIIATAEAIFAEFVMAVKNVTPTFYTNGNDLGNQITDGLIDAIENRRLEVVNAMVKTIEDAIAQAQKAAQSTSFSIGGRTRESSAAAQVAAFNLNQSKSTLSASTSSKLASRVSSAQAQVQASKQKAYANQSQNGSTSTSSTTYTFNQYNSSPKSLSRTEIYRDTRNLFAKSASTGREYVVKKG